jgi:hypothetical protein
MDYGDIAARQPARPEAVGVESIHQTNGTVERWARFPCRWP